MEQQLINELIRLISKMGGEAVMKELIEQVNTDNNPKTWTAGELEKALEYIRWQNTYLGEGDVIAIIRVLLEKYNLHIEDISSPAGAFTKEGTRPTKP